jgi:hypothetical protein
MLARSALRRYRDVRVGGPQHLLQAQHAVDTILPVLKLGHPLRAPVIPLAPVAAPGAAAAVAWTFRFAGVFGEGAADLIHFGASLVAQERSAFDLQYQAFPAVTLHEVYKAAANAVVETLAHDVEARARAHDN